VVYDSKTDTTRVDLPIKEICSGLPRKVIKDVAPEFLGGPVKIPKNMTLKRAIKNVLRLPSVCSKEFHVHHVDGSVTGLRVQAQQCGPLHLPVSDFAISSVDYQGSFGLVSAIGECAPKMMLDSPKGASMAVAELFSNLSGALIPNQEDIKLSVNWMWAAKGIKGGVAKMYMAMELLKNDLEILRIAGIGGKDSSSLFVEVKMVITKSPETLVLTAIVTVPNITKFVTPDIKHPGRSRLLLIDTANGHNRLGGSAFLQTLSQLGDECPDVNMKLVANAFLAEQELIRRDLITASHDRTGDGGLFVNLLEMLAAGDCGAEVNLHGGNLYATLFAEEAGKIIEYLPENEETITEILKMYGLPYQFLGYTTKSDDFTLNFNGSREYADSIVELRHQWRETSYQIEKHRLNPKCALVERRNTKHAGRPNYKLTFDPYFPAVIGQAKPPVAVIRTKVSTGQRETAAGLMRYFNPYDIHISDLLNGKARLNDYLGIFLTPGFSFQDIFGAGKGFAMQFLRNPRLMDQFAEFMAHKNTFFSGSCNGCQAGGWLEVLGLPQVKGYPPLLFVQNDSRDFEHRFVNLEILESPSILFKGMAGSRIGAWVAHGEGKVWLANSETKNLVEESSLITLAYVDDKGRKTERYPFNPNGSINGWTGFCDKTGRFNIMMPHPTDRSFLMRQWAWIPPEFKGLDMAPWMRVNQNLREWCDKN
jgi:phosphoribosylformylglycinamidine synthase